MEAQLASLNQAAQEQQQTLETAHETQLLLAEGILQHKVINQLIKPMQARWMAQAASSCSTPQVTWQDELQQLCSNTDWSSVLQLTAQTSVMMEPLLMATAEQFLGILGQGVEELRQMSVEFFQKLLVLMELLSPDRYPQCLVARVEQPAAAVDPAVPRQHTGDAATTDAEQPQLDPISAAKQLLANLKELRACMSQGTMAAAVLMLHKMEVIAQVSAMDLASGEVCSPTLAHCMPAARRLRLTSRQLQHLQLLRQQFLRMSLQQRDAGLHMLGMANHSLNLQASLVGGSAGSGLGASLGSAEGHCRVPQSGSGVEGAAGAAGRAGLAAGSASSATGMGVGTAPGTTAAAAAAEGGLGRQLLCQGEGGPGHQQAAGLQEEGQDENEEEEEDDEGAEGVAVLDDLLQQHVHNTADIMSVVSMWAFNSLSCWQVAQYIVASWPYNGCIPLLVEAAPLLTPEDGPVLRINPDICEEAAQAAVLAEQLGYTGAEGYMQRRCAALEQQLDYVLRHHHL